MLTITDFFWSENGSKTKANNLCLESYYPLFDSYVKDSETYEVYNALAIKTYRATFNHYGDAIVSVIEYIDKNGLLDHFWNVKTHDQLSISALNHGVLVSK